MNKLILFASNHAGPGGRNCPCCGPAPRTRRKADRTAKRRLRKLLDRIDAAAYGSEEE
jgi:hypothetical protein